MDTLLEHVHLSVPSTFEALEGLVEQMQALVGKYVPEEEAAYRIVLAASEAVTNAMKHGNAFDAAKDTVVDARVFADRFEVSVQDEGRGFDRARVGDPLEEAHLLDPSGRGLYLIEMLADEVAYTDGGRCVEMQFRREQ